MRRGLAFHGFFVFFLNNREDLGTSQVQQFPCCDRQQSSGGADSLWEFGLRSLERIKKDTWGVTSIYSWLQQSGLQCYGEFAEQRERRKK